MAPKSAKRLHVLNGDATQPEFYKSHIDGDVVIWREVLVEGPVAADIRSTSFWNNRGMFLEAAYGGDPTYAEVFLSQLQLLDNLNDIEEVVLWFEFDLFCQINMLGCLNYVQHDNISLVCLANDVSQRSASAPG